MDNLSSCSILSSSSSSRYVLHFPSPFKSRLLAYVSHEIDTARSGNGATVVRFSKRRCVSDESRRGRKMRIPPFIYRVCLQGARCQVRSAPRERRLARAEKWRLKWMPIALIAVWSFTCRTVARAIITARLTGRRTASGFPFPRYVREEYALPNACAP